MIYSMHTEAETLMITPHFGRDLILLNKLAQLSHDLQVGLSDS